MTDLYSVVIDGAEKTRHIIRQRPSSGGQERARVHKRLIKLENNNWNLINACGVFWQTSVNNIMDRNN